MPIKKRVKKEKPQEKASTDNYIRGAWLAYEAANGGAKIDVTPDTMLHFMKWCVEPEV